MGGSLRHHYMTYLFEGLSYVSGDWWPCELSDGMGIKSTVVLPKWRLSLNADDITPYEITGLFKYLEAKLD